jgi:hypothetical protein
VITVGDTREEAELFIHEAIEFHIEGLRDERTPSSGALKLRGRSRDNFRRVGRQRSSFWKATAAVKLPA